MRSIEAAGGQAVALAADVTDESAVEGAVSTAVDTFGGLDVLVANAGIELMEQDAAVHELDLNVWQQTVDVNLTGMFLTCKYGVRPMLANQAGAIIITGSPTGLFGYAVDEHAYSASKSGCHGLARAMAGAYGPRGIRVNVVIPGLIETPLSRPLFDDEPQLAAFVASIPLRRPGRPEEVAAMVAFLASDDASYSAGGFYMVDGGYTAV